jgi:hypothetical protein
MGSAVTSPDTPDSRRIDFLADITNLSVLRDSGHMLRGGDTRTLDKTADALSTGYELHRRTMDTPAAFRAAVDDAIKDCEAKTVSRDDMQSAAEQLFARSESAERDPNDVAAEISRSWRKQRKPVVTESAAPQGSGGACSPESAASGSAAAAPDDKSQTPTPHSRIVKALAAIVLLHDDDNGRIARDPVMQEVQHIRGDADQLQRELAEAKERAKRWQQIADARAIEVADLKHAAKQQSAIGARQVDKQVVLQASEYGELAKNARRYEWLRDHMRRMPLGERGIRHFFDQPGTMSFQEAVDAAIDRSAK